MFKDCPSLYSNIWILDILMRFKNIQDYPLTDLTFKDGAGLAQTAHCFSLGSSPLTGRVVV